MSVGGWGDGNRGLGVVSYPSQSFFYIYSQLLFCFDTSVKNGVEKYDFCLLNPFFAASPRRFVMQLQP